MIIKLGAGKLNMAQICGYTGGFLVGDGEAVVEGICTDSREAEAGILFVALRGERSDGHDYIAAAHKRGCACVIAERHDAAIPRGVTAVIVGDSQRALIDTAGSYCKKVDCRRVAITGSVGKTTTKEFVCSVLEEGYRAHKTTGNFNSLIGMPLTMLETPADTEVSVLEFAMSGFGEIEQMSRAARPDIAVITNIGTSHMEMLGSRENICRAKFEILAGLDEGGVLILNGDEPMMLGYPRRPARTIYVAQKNSGADYFAYDIRKCGMETVFSVAAGENNFLDIRIPALGNHNVYAALFAFAAGSVLGLSEEQIRRGLMKYCSADMRQKIYDLDGITVIEDCYNASPESMRAALDVLCDLREDKSRAALDVLGDLREDKSQAADTRTDKKNRAFALLGDMRELGVNAEMFHRSVGAYAAERGVDILFTIGSLARHIAAGAVAAGMDDDNICVNLDEDTYAATAAELSGILRAGDTLLIKASRALRAERVIEELCMLRGVGKNEDGD